MKKPEYYFVIAKNLRHIARKSRVWTLCQRFYNDSDSRFVGKPNYQLVTSTEQYKKGRDCKTCFRKAKLNILEAE